MGFNSAFKGLIYIKITEAEQLNSHGDSDEIILKEWELLHICRLPNIYYNEVEFVVCVILTPVFSI